MRSNELNNKPLFGSRWLHSQMRSIEGELANSPLSQKKYQVLTKKLDQASRKLEDLEKTSGVFAKAQTEYLKEKVIALSKDLVDRHVEAEITQIQKESCSLRKKISAEAVKKLETHIAELERNHKTSLPHRRIVAEAKAALCEAKAKLEGKPSPKHFQWLTNQKNSLTLEEIELLPGDIEELFDIAKAIYEHDMRQAKIRFNQLPDDHKRRCKAHLQNLMAKAFDDSLETIQALIATANELVQNGETYLTRSQIDQLFLGLSQVIEEEKAEGKVHAFPKTHSLGA